jgi:hypothetical protein
MSRLRAAIIQSAGVVVVALGLVVAPSATLGADAGPRVELRSEQQLPPFYGQGIARGPGGWILSGTNILARFGDDLSEQQTLVPAIPPEWAAKGYRHVGDIDVVGPYVYAPFEQPDFSKGRQATARYDVATLRFVDAVELPQHENSFVTLDPATMVAYTMNHFDGKALLRYDVRAGWKPLRPLAMDRLVRKVQGASLAEGAVWLSTDDDRNGLYRVDLHTGHVGALGSMGHLSSGAGTAKGEGEGIDAHHVGAAFLHTLTVDPSLVPVWLGNWDVTGVSASRATSSATDSSWPPVLVGLVVMLALGALIFGIVVFRRARAAARS